MKTLMALTVSGKYGTTHRYIIFEVRTGGLLIDELPGHLLESLMINKDFSSWYPPDEEVERVLRTLPFTFTDSTNEPTDLEPGAYLRVFYPNDTRRTGETVVEGYVTEVKGRVINPRRLQQRSKKS